MGEVYLARDTRLGREVAIKVLPEGLAGDPERLKRFEKEARSASALNHPNIVTIHEIGSEGGVSYIAMERVEGSTLRELLAEGPLPTKKILSLAAQVAEGLAKAHGAGIVHRDLKPENVMVSKDGFVKILDFGLAKLVEPESGEVSAMPTLVQPETHPGTVMGTVAYMSPEQASGEPLDFRSDQFSFGSMLYEMTTGQRAFQRKTAAETMSAIIRDEPEPVAKLRPELPLPLRWMLERCLAKDREERYASTRDLARDLASVRDHISEVTSGAEAMLATAGKGKSRRRALPLVLGLALCAAALLAGWVARGLRSVPPPAPSFKRLTFRKGQLGNARFAADGQTIVYGAVWDGERGVSLYQTRVGSPESGRFEFGTNLADILAISGTNELAILLGFASPGATLARVPMSGGTPREVLEGVAYAGADFAPDGKELAVAHVVEGKARLEFPIGNVLVPQGVDCPRFSPDGENIAFLEEGEGQSSLSVIDRLGKSKRIVSSGWASIVGAPGWRPDGREIWFTASASAGDLQALWAVDLAGRRRLVMRVPGGLELDDISRNGQILIAHHTITRTVRIASAGEPKEREISWLDASFVADLSSDGKTLLLTERGEGSGSGAVIYLRGTDGSPAAKLGEGFARALSPDGKLVLAARTSGGKNTSVVLPTGAGQAQTLDEGGLSDFGWGDWLPDGKGIVFSAIGPGGVSRLYVQALPDGKPRAIGPEKTSIQNSSNPVSPDGKYVVGLHAGQALLVPIDGSGEARAVAGVSPPDDRVIQWSSDSRALYVCRVGERPAKVWLLDLETGQKRLWKEIAVEEGLGDLQVRVTPDGSTWVHSGRKVVSELYLVEGLR